MQRNIPLYYFLSVVCSAAFISGNWIFYWLLFMNYRELGIVDALSFAFGLIMEIPTGAISDMIGKKKTVVVAMLCGTAGWLTMGAADTLSILIVGFWITQIGWAFYSGAAEALVFDTLKADNQTTRFEQVMARKNSLTTIMYVVSTLIGGVLYALHFRLPHLGWGVAYGFGFMASFFLIEPPAETEKFSLRGYTNQLSQGFRQLALPTLRPFLPLIFAILGGFFLFVFGLLQPAIATGFGFYANEQAVLFAILGVIAAFANALIPAMRRRLGDKQGLVMLGAILALGYFGAALPLGYLGLFAIACIRLSGEIAQPWISIVVNHAIDSRYRATTLSTIALLMKIPYVATAIIAGIMIEAGTFWLFNVITASIILGLVILGLLMRHQVMLEKPIEAVEPTS